MKKSEMKEPAKEVKKKSIPSKEYVLIRDVKVGKVLRKKGEKIKLTEKGRKFFKQNKYIK